MIVHSNVPEPEPKTIFHLRPSKWNYSAASLYNSLTQSAKQKATVICLTEVADGKRPQTLDKWTSNNGWSVLQDRNPWQSGETAILYDNRTWSVIDWATVPIGPDLGPGLPVVATIAILKHRSTNNITIVSVSHLPSAVEQIWNVKGAKRVFAYRRMVVRYRKAVNRWRKEFKPDFEAVSADWNINFLKPWARAYIKTAWPKHRLARGSNEGTHGKRQIDGWLLRGAKGNIDVLPSKGTSDHAVTELTISRVL